ncbi:MAG TPA: gliding motility-associated C-terminal domain-containing protein [Chitinophagaceae bacterium]|nr:gliding motility-associated C-terminal domain-containing protein [Chitinophagaceae bacterium]
MKKNCLEKWHFSLAIIFIFLASISVQAQGYNSTTWKFTNPTQFGFSVTDIDFVDNNNVIAVGTDGGIAKSTNGGATWTYGAFSYVMPTGYLSKASFMDVHYVTPDVAYAVGSTVVSSGSVFGGGVLAKTSDGGVTWTMVSNPLYLNRRNINTCWFLNRDTGYIAGSWNTIDSIPKLYYTRNGGATWDSMAAPIGGKTKGGYVNNPNVPSLDLNIDAKAKEIYRIEFLNDSIGYITGGTQSGGNYFPSLISVNASTCLPTTSFTTSGGGDASLVWKFSSGTLKDYSISKERLGLNGIYNTAPNCTYRYASNGLHTNVYRAIRIINDSTLLVISSNNNIVIKIYTGKNDSTANINFPGIYEKGRYQVLNTTNPIPINNTNLTGTSIPAVNPALFQQPTQIRMASNGKLYAGINSPVISPVNKIMTSVDTGRTWVAERALPLGKPYSNFGTIAIDIAPNGKFIAAGQAGVVSDSMPGSPGWQSNYNVVAPGGSYNQIEFADCANGMVVGSSFITVTTDGGKTWIDKNRADFAANFYTIGGFAYPSASKSYFAVSSGIVYSSVDQGTTLDPAYSNFNFQMRDVAAIGTDSVWAVGAGSTSVPTASRKPGIFRSFDGGLTWTEYSNFTAGTLAQTFTEVEFPSKTTGYAAGSRDTIWKTTDAGVTWFKLPLPTPGVTPQITYSDMVAVDNNTVIITGNGFPRSVVFKTTDGGNTWADITSNATTLRPESNIFGVMFQDATNGYIATGGGIMKTTNGGTSWTLDYAPSSGFSAMGFAPRKVPAAISFQNRKLFVSGPTPNILEYGNPANISINTTETVVNATCTNLTAGSITVNATGAIAPYTFSIDGGAFQSSNAFAGLAQGAHILTVKDSYCGTMTKTVNVGFTDNLVLTTRNDTIVCSGAPVQMSASTNGTGATYAWMPAGGLSATNISNPVATVNSNSAFTVTASLNGCIKNKTINIGIKPNPVINAGPDKTIVEGDEVTLNGTGIANPVSIAWTPSASIISGANNYAAVVKPITTTTYTLTVKNSDNCTSTDNAVVTVMPYCIKVMNAFTPNGDGMNDKWLVTNGGCTKEIKVTVFNRYGAVIYTNNNYSNDWDGTYKGKPVADGTYYYSVTYQTITGKPITLSGDLTILR